MQEHVKKVVRKESIAKNRPKHYIKSGKELGWKAGKKTNKKWTMKYKKVAINQFRRLEKMQQGTWQKQDIKAARNYDKM